MTMAETVTKPSSPPSKAENQNVNSTPITPKQTGPNGTPPTSPRPALKKRLSGDYSANSSFAAGSPKVSNKKVSFSSENEVFELIQKKYIDIPEKPQNAEDTPTIKYTNSPASKNKKKKNSTADSLRVDTSQTPSSDSCCNIPDTLKSLLSYFNL